MRWEPSTESELLQAYNEGMLEERNWCDLKREVENTKGANKELARDLASFATDGGTLIIGLDEAEPDGNPLHPVLLANQAERIERIALDRIDPPLTISCTLVKSEADETAGYILVHVPASAMAPHQVGGIYYGRGDKTKRSLPDSEVQRLFARRADWTKGIEEDLRSAVHADPFGEDGEHGHLFLVAKPTGGWQGIFQDFTAGPNWKNNLQRIRQSTVADPIVSQILHSMFPREPISFHFNYMLTTRKTSHGALLTSRGINVPYDDPAELATLDLEVGEDGGVRFFYGGAVRNAQKENSEGRQEPRIYLVPVMQAIREFIKAIAVLSDLAGYAAMWDIGLAITNLNGAYGIGISTWGASSAETWSDKSYERMTRASVAEVGKMPALVAERLIGRLLRTYSADDQFRPLLSDTPISAG
jgi:hypothetical protein